MSLRQLLIDLAFNTEVNKLLAVDSAIDEIKNSTISSTSAISNMGSVTAKTSNGMIERLNDLNKNFRNVGGKLTKYVTTPITGLLTAAGGLATALGFKRLVAMDEAMAKLRGLGYEGEAVKGIMDDVRGAVTGTTYTMAEGVDVAAGALAAGVAQGAELERYVKLIGDAATGSNTTMAEMAQIFNRIQGAGRLMTGELDMIEYRMPGFSQALARHFGVTSEKIREMVTAGEVSADEFLNVMEGFAGGMSDAFADTWSGLTKNVMSNIGILGEYLLEGLFVDGKEGLKSLLETLRSDELRTWAKETGKSIREMVQNVVDFLSRMKAAWDDLSPPVQNIIKRVALFGILTATVIGPVILFFGKVFAAIVSVAGAVSKVIGFFKGLGGAIALLSNPVTLVIVGIAGLIATIVWAYNRFVWFRDAVQAVWQAVSMVISTAWSVIQAVIGVGIAIITGIIQAGMAVLQGNWSGAWGAIKGIAQNIWTNIEAFFSSIDLFEIGKSIIKGLIDGIKSMVGAVGDAVSNIGSTVVEKFRSFFGIASPSKLMMEYGVSLGEGLQLGMQESTPWRNDRMPLVPEVIVADDRPPLVPETAPVAAGQYYTGGSPTFAVTINVNNVGGKGNEDLVRAIDRRLRQTGRDLINRYFETELRRRPVGVR